MELSFHNNPSIKSALIARMSPRTEDCSMSKMTDSEAAEVLNVMFQFCANDRQMTEADALAKAIARLREPAGVAGFNEGVLQSRQNLQRTLAQRAAVGVSPPSGVAWHPIETAPKDNKHPLYLAQFNPDTGELIELDWDASWEAESESWEIPQVYYIWRSANGRVEEPTHWAYQNALAQQPAAVDGAMVERGVDAALTEIAMLNSHRSPREEWRELVRAVLTAALAAQHQEPTT